MKYIYFVAYWTETGPGNVNITLPKKIDRIEDVRTLETGISEKFGFPKVSITNYILLDTEQE